MLLTEGQMSDHKGARIIVDKLPPAKTLIGDRGYDSNRFRKSLTEKGIEPCIPPTKNRKQPIEYDKALYKQRHRIENMFAKLRTGAALPCAMTVAHTRSSQPSASQRPSCSTCSE